MKTIKLKTLRFFILIIVFFLCRIELSAQFSFKHIDKNEGLSHNNVECILKDSDGFLWFGTRNGLCRYDGSNIKVYRNSINANSISGNRIMSIAEDYKGNLWVGTYQNGLNKFDKKTNSFIHYGNDKLIGEQVYRIRTFSDGTIYIGSTNGLAIYNEKTDNFEVFLPSNKKNSINSHLVSDICKTKNGQIYIATWANDIQRFDPKTKEFFSINYIQNTSRPFVNFRKRILEDKKGNLWISAQKHGLCKYNPQTGNAKFFFKTEGGINSEILNGDMVLLPNNKLWIASDGGGINVFDIETEGFEYIKTNANEAGAISSDHIYTLYLDNNNCVWVGTFDQGVDYYDPEMNKFQNKLFSEELINFFKGKSVISAFQDSKLRIWIGTDGNGLHYIENNKSLKSFYFNEKDTNSVSSNVITSINEDAFGNVLIGTYAGGFNIFNEEKETFTHFTSNLSESKNVHSENVWTILSDSEQKVWLGLLGMGVDIYFPKSKTFKNVGPYSNELLKIGHPNVMAIMEDSDGDIWFGTEGAGVFIYDKQAKKVLNLYSNEFNFTENGVIKAFYQDKRSNIWIATEGDGLFKYNKIEKKTTQYTTANGLPGMIIHGILEDEHSNIWVATYDGLAFKSENSLYFTTFSKIDGLSSNEFNAKAFIKLRNGDFIAGSINGIDVFNPEALNINQTIPEVIFSKLEVFNKEILPGDTLNQRVILTKDIAFTQEIKISYFDKIFAIEFVALQYTHPEKCQYKYMLEGFDNDWILTNSTRRMATYSNLPSGTYTLKVKASNNEGQWGNNTTEIKIIVEPPFWKTFWFILLLVLFFLGLIALIYYNRMQFLKKTYAQEKILNDKKILELENENYESELEKLTFYTVNRNRVLVNYKTRLLSLATKAKESVRKGLELVIEDIDNEIGDDKEWIYIEPRLDKFYDQFVTKLRERHPDLTLSEIKVATYVRMNLSSKEISEFMHKTTRAVENDRYRLRKKINLDSNESLKDYLLNL